jgi:hypothetical protein
MRSFRGDGGGAGRKLVLARRSQGSDGGCRAPTAAAGTLLRRAVEAAPPSVTSIEEAAVGLEVVALRAEVVVVVRGRISVEEAGVRLRVQVEGVGRRDIFRTTCIVRIFLFIFYYHIFS